MKTDIRTVVTMGVVTGEWSVGHEEAILFLHLVLAAGCEKSLRKVTIMTVHILQEWYTSIKRV